VKVRRTPVKMKAGVEAGFKGKWKITKKVFKHFDIKLK
jgi:uncharacterized cupin superfamily protein